MKFAKVIAIYLAAGTLLWSITEQNAFAATEKTSNNTVSYINEPTPAPQQKKSIKQKTSEALLRQESKVMQAATDIKNSAMIELQKARDLLKRNQQHMSSAPPPPKKKPSLHKLLEKEPPMVHRTKAPMSLHGEHQRVQQRIQPQSALATTLAKPAKMQKISQPTGLARTMPKEQLASISARLDEQLRKYTGGGAQAKITGTELALATAAGAATAEASAKTAEEKAANQLLFPKHVLPAKFHFTEEKQAKIEKLITADDLPRTYLKDVEKKFPGKPITLNESLPHLMTIDYSIKAAQQNEISDKNAVWTAWAAYLPTVSGTANYGRDDITNPGTTADTDMEYHDEGLAIKQLLVDFGKTISDIKIAKETHAQSITSLLKTRQDVLVEGISAYTDVVRDSKILQLTLLNEKNVQEQLEMESKSVKLGFTNLTDLIEVKAQLSSTLARVVQAKESLQISRDRYKAIFQEDPGDFSDASLPKMPDRELPKTLREAIHIAFEHNLQLVSLRQDIEIAREKITGAKSEFGPSVTLNGDVTNKFNVAGTRGNKRERKVSVQLAYPLFNSGGDLAALRSARADLYSAQDSYINTQLTIEKNVGDNWESLQGAEANYKYLKLQSDQLDRFLELATKERQLGKRTLLELLVADTNSINAKTQSATAQAKVITSAYDLLQSMGVLKVSDVN